MSVNEAHVYIADYSDHGIGFTSPQLPLLVGGASTPQQAMADLFEVAVQAGLNPRGSVIEHYQIVFEVDSDVFAVRVRQDAYSEARGAIAARSRS